MKCEIVRVKGEKKKLGLPGGTQMGLEHEKKLPKEGGRVDLGQGFNGFLRLSF